MAFMSDFINVRIIYQDKNRPRILRSLIRYNELDINSHSCGLLGPLSMCVAGVSSGCELRLCSGLWLFTSDFINVRIIYQDKM